jgi:chemotaxis protein MotB
MAESDKISQEPDDSDISNGDTVDLHIEAIDDDTIPEDVLSPYSRFNPNRPPFYAERRHNPQTVFQTDLPDFSASQVPATHWSVAWSDLMMTMFVLFFTLYVTRIDHPQNLVDNTPDSVVSAAASAQETKKIQVVTLPVTRIIRTSPGSVTEQEKDEDTSRMLNPQAKENVRHPLMAPLNTAPSTKESRRGEQYSEIIDTQEAARGTSSTPMEDGNALPAPPRDTDLNQDFQQVYDASQSILKKNNLEAFASIDIIPDQAVRLILTGDLLFNSGNATLSAAAQRSLQKLAPALNRSGFQISVEGHTDNIPISSNFRSNRELSLARANAVARFLIEDMNMDPGQIVVSGFSSYRPVASNSRADGRARNRRVEIILSRSPSPPVRSR